MTTAPAQRLHDFGTLGQRWSLDLWRAVWSSQIQIVGTLGILATVFLRPFEWIPWALIGAWLLPFLLFPTLLIVHGYYQVEAGALLILAAALLLENARAAVLPIILSQLFISYQGYDLRPNPAADADIRLALLLKERTAPDDVIVTYAAGWSPSVAYYSERKMLIETPLEPLDEVVARDSKVSGYHVGAVVRCTTIWDGDSRYEALFPSRPTEGCGVWFK